MPSESRSQQRLMGMAYAVKTGKILRSKIDRKYIKKVDELVKNMTVDQLKDFAETSHEGLPEEVKEESSITPDSINGMGATKFPSETEVGSGDIPMNILIRRRKRLQSERKSKA